MYRMGLVDFWYYTQEDFYFKNGHLLLRGSNGSGKSVTMQSFIPILLDGNKNSERLDAFGTKARKMESYLIDENSSRDDRIAYLYLEFKREGADVFKTIGMGLHARKNKPMDTWYFVIEDNQRIGKDILLMEHNLAITKQTLKKRLQNQYIDTQREYMTRVNQALFQFPTIDDYKEAINLLVKLRSPKLSNSLKPTIINDLLSASLQPLSEEDLRPLTDALSNMDEIQNQLEVLKQSLQAAKSIQSVYAQYNSASLDKKVVQYLHENKALEDVQNQIKSFVREKEKAKQNLSEIQMQSKQLQMEQSVLEEEYSGLANQDLLQLASDVQRLKEDLNVQKESLASKQTQEEKKEDAYISCKLKYDKQKDVNNTFVYDMQASFKQLDEFNQNMQFDEHISLKNDFLEHLENPYDFSYTKSKIDKEIDELKEGLHLFQQLNYQKTLLTHAQENYEKEQSHLESIESELDAYQNQLRSLKEEYHEKFLVWNDQNHILKIDTEKMKEFLDIISDYGNSDEYFEIDDCIHQQYIWYLKTKTESVSKLHIETKQVQKEIKDLSEQLEYWKVLKDPQPEIDENQVQARKYLKDNNIPFIPFYTLLDFDLDLTHEEKNCIEEQLVKSSIMNSLIVSSSYKNEILHMPKGLSESFLFTSKKMEDLKVYSIQHKIDIKDLCDFFGLELSEIHFDSYGYKMGNITHIISHNRQSIFIGKASREAFRLNKIEELENQLNSKDKIKRDLQENIKNLENQLSLLEHEYHSYPTKNDLDSCLQDIQRVMLKQENVIEQIKVFVEQIQSYKDVIQKIYKQITAISMHLQITNTQDVFELRKEMFTDYKEVLIQIETLHEKYIVNLDLFTSISSQLEDLRIDLDSIRDEKSQLDQQVLKTEKLVSVKENQLNQMGYENIKARMGEITSRLKAIPMQITNLSKEDGKWNNVVVQCEKSLKEIQSVLERQEQQTQMYKLALEQELDLKYVKIEEKDPNKIHKMIKDMYPNLKSKETLATDLQRSFFMNRGFLQDYGLRIVNLFEQEEDVFSRLDIYARYHGKQLSFEQLLKQLELDIIKQGELVSSQERSIIEDVLVNTISQKIRVHIQGSKRWITKMNQYMKDMNTSSTLKLSLQWKSKKAETEDELSSEALVKLLEKDLQLLKESDFEALSKHFRSKILSARKLSEDPNINLSFHQVMRNMLDYRTWFDFTILYEKANEKKKELTNNRFYVFSGGEKAMAMYIPLFSAVAAKFSLASSDAPLIIALDEAFAGVDSTNIDSMFGLIKKFGFDYIMNSQVLWGDYPNVDSLAIYELYRPAGVEYVTTIRYEWDGHIKRLVS